MLMPIQIRIWIGINMEIWIRIRGDCITMPIHKDMDPEYWFLDSRFVKKINRSLQQADRQKQNSDLALSVKDTLITLKDAEPLLVETKHKIKAVNKKTYSSIGT